MRSKHANELRWFFDGSYECAIGIKSAHVALVAMLEGGAGNTDAVAANLAEERVLEAVGRANAVRDVLHRCSKKTQRVLAAYYCPEKLSTYWRELTHVLPLTGKYNRRTHGPVATGIGLRMEVASATVEQKEQVMMLRRTAEELAVKAHAEYADGADGREASRRGRAQTVDG